MGALETASSLNSGQAPVPSLCITVASPFPPRATAQGCRAMNDRKLIISPHPEKAGCGERHQRMVGQECASSMWSQTQAGCRILWHTRYIFRTSCITYDLHQTLRAVWWPKRGGVHIFLPLAPQSACSHLPSRPAWPPSLCYPAHCSLSALTAAEQPGPVASAAVEESMEAF